MIKKLRIIPLGGIEEVGKNCTVLEYGDDIVVIDLGIDFPGPDLPGIDYILPDITYLEENKERIKGLVITHGHLDHIGAISYYLHKINNPPIFTTPLTRGLISDRLAEVGLGRKVKQNLMKPNQGFSLGVFKITPFRVVHNIPDSMGLIIETPVGIVVHTGDFKIDDNPDDQKPLEKEKLKKWSEKGILALLSDSTNATLPGHSVPEKQVGKIIEQIIKDAPGRIIFTTFSSLISRIQQIVRACQKQGKKIALVGMSMQKTVRIAQSLGYLNVSPGTFVDHKQINKYPDQEVLILSAGAQGVEGSSMARISENKHWSIKIKKGDTVVFSSSAVPGNELAITRMMDGLVNQGAKIIYRSVLGSGVHSSGHAFQDELKEMIKLVRPKFFIPTEGQHYMHASHIELAKSLGIKEENCFMLYNGQTLEIDQYQAKVLKKRLPSLFIAVEGNQIKTLDKDAVRSRNKIAESGVCFVSVVQKRVQLVFQGLTVDNHVVEETKKKARKLVEKYGKKKNAKTKIQTSLSDFILNRTGKKPLVVLIIN